MNTKKLYIVEYDENGNEIDKNLLAENDGLLKIYGKVDLFINFRYFADKDLRDFFTDSQWQLIEMLERDLNYVNGTMDNDALHFWKTFFNEKTEKQGYILSLVNFGKGPQDFFVNTNREVLPVFNSSNIHSVSKWVNSRDGIYYAINDKRIKMWDFIDKPSLAQAQYQQSQGRQVVYLSFKDWKIYNVSLSELE